MIIGVDGTRVTDLPDLENSLRDVQPGETVYLSLIHNGAREQLPVLIPRH
jgi:S1-C subfamily serine protease